MRIALISLATFVLTSQVIGCRGGGIDLNNYCREVSMDDGTYYCCSNYTERDPETNRALGCKEEGNGKPCDPTRPACKCQMGAFGLCICKE